MRCRRDGPDGPRPELKRYVAAFRHIKVDKIVEVYMASGVVVHLRWLFDPRGVSTRRLFRWTARFTGW